MRYFFDVIDNGFPFIDVEGKELPDEIAAVAEARQRALHHGEAKRRKGSVPSGRIRLRDETGQIIEDVPID
jgi:hypothetical protein